MTDRKHRETAKHTNERQKTPMANIKSNDKQKTLMTDRKDNRQIEKTIDRHYHFSKQTTGGLCEFSIR